MKRFFKDHILASLGWVFIELAARSPNWAFHLLSWSHDLGCWFYDLAYSGRYDLDCDRREKFQEDEDGIT